MATGMLFIGWGEIIPGREQKALQVFGETLQYYTGLQERGEITGFEPALVEPHGGDLGGFILVRGERERLARLRSDAEFLRQLTRAQLVVQKVGVVAAYTGEELQNLMGTFQQQLAELA